MRRKKKTNLLFLVLPLIPINHLRVLTSITPRRLDCPPTHTHYPCIGHRLVSEWNKFSHMYLWVSYTSDCSGDVSEASREGHSSDCYDGESIERDGFMRHPSAGVFSCFLMSWQPKRKLLAISEWHCPLCPRHTVLCLIKVIKAIEQISLLTRNNW